MASEDSTSHFDPTFQPRLIPHVVTEHARKTPDKIWASIPNSPHDATQGYKDITYAQLNSAVTRAARWLQDHIEPQRAMKHEALAYIGSPDSRYIIFTIAAIKAGFQVRIQSHFLITSTFLLILTLSNQHRCWSYPP